MAGPGLLLSSSQVFSMRVFLPPKVCFDMCKARLEVPARRIAAGADSSSTAGISGSVNEYLRLLVRFPADVHWIDAATPKKK